MPYPAVMRWDRGWRQFSVTFGRDLTDEVVTASVLQLDDDMSAMEAYGHEGQVAVGLAGTRAEPMADVLVRAFPDPLTELSAQDAVWLEDRVWPVTAAEEVWRNGRYCPMVAVCVGGEQVLAKTRDGLRVRMRPHQDDHGRYGRWLGGLRPRLTSYPAVVAAWVMFCPDVPLPSRIRVRLLHHRWHSHDMAVTTMSEPFTSLLESTTNSA